MMTLSTLLLDDEGNEINGYFWATDDPEDALENAVQRAWDEGVEYNCIIVAPLYYVVEDGNEEEILGRYADGEYEYYDRD